MLIAFHQVGSLEAWFQIFPIYWTALEMDSGAKEDHIITIPDYGLHSYNPSCTPTKKC